MLLLLFSVESSAQDRTVSGVILSGEDNLPLPGVNVRVAGTNRGTITSMDGEYTIQVTNEDVLQFSFIGYLTAERKVNNQNTIDVVLEVDTQTLGEVVVVGYGSNILCRSKG
jgi:hypothetical protein